MNKIGIGISIALVIACIVMGILLRSTLKDLYSTEISLATAQKTIKDREKEIEVTNKTMANLMHEKEALVQERLAANATIQELLSRSNNCAWGKEELPADVQSFLESIRMEGMEKKK